MGDTKEPEGERDGERESRRVNLTDKSIRSLPPGAGRPRDYSDTVQRGLRLRVSPSGERTFLLAYRRPKDGVSVKLAIGSLAERMTLSKARKEAAELLTLLRREPPIDPAEERRRRRDAARAEAILFSQACDAFVVEELPKLRPSTRTGWERFIEREIKPALGERRPEEITPDDLADLRATIERGTPGPKAKDGSPTWKRKPAPVSARRCFEVVRRVFAWLSTADPEVAHLRRRHGLARLEANPAAPAAAFRRKRANGKSRATAAAKAYTDDQLRAIYTAVRAEVERTAADARAWEAEHPRATRQQRVDSTTLAHEIETRAFANLLDLIAHTGVRAHDARAARTEDIDQGRKLWAIQEHKTSDHTGAPHVVPLSTGALAAFAQIRKANLAAGHGRKEWLFPADTTTCEVCERGGHVDKDSKAAKRIKARAGVDGRGLLHRLRDTIKTRMSEHGIDGRVSEAILAHVQTGTAGIYDHAELLPQRRDALEWWSVELAGILAKTPRNGMGEASQGDS